MLLARLPRLRDGSVATRRGLRRHVPRQRELRAARGRLRARRPPARCPTLLPCEIYCHSLTDPTILGPELVDAGAQTLTLFGAAHARAAVRRRTATAARARRSSAALASLDSVLAEPIEDCLLREPDGAPCIEARTPLDLEDELALPGGNIFHRDLAWPFAEDDGRGRRLGRRDRRSPTCSSCGAGARRGGGVSGIPGRNAAMAILGR